MLNALNLWGHILRRATFAAVVSAAPSNTAIDRIERRGAAGSIVRIALPDGWLTLFRRGGGIVPAGNPLVTLDGTGGGNEIAMPGALIDAGMAPAGLRAVVRQHRSYLWLDQNRLVCWTDHLALAPLYHAAFDGGHVISDDPALLAELLPGIDDAMVARFLVNGIMLGDRTLFRGVRALPPATITTLSPGAGIETARYWQHLPGREPWTDRDEMQRDLWSRVTGAVAERVAGRQAVIALSGGFDSSALLAILHRSGHDLSTFSFVLGMPRAGSDADVARRQAAMLGVEHHLYQLPAPFELVPLFREHLDAGVFMRKPCFELRALETAAADARARWSDPILLFGDEAFGQGALRLDSSDEVLAASTLKDPELIDKLAAALPDGEAARLADALRGFYDGMLDGIPTAADKRDTVDHLFLDMFLIANMMQIRGGLVAPRIPIALPYMDLGVLHMARHVPAHLRVDKAMFEAAAAHNHPEVFALRRAMTRQSQPDATELVRANAGLIEEEIHRLGGSGLMSPAVLLSALKLVRKRDDGRSRLYALMLATGKQLRQRQLVPRAVTNMVQQRIWAKFRTGVGPAVLFMRLLYLAMLVDRIIDGNRRIGEAESDTPGRILLDA